MTKRARFQWSLEALTSFVLIAGAIGITTIVFVTRFSQPEVTPLSTWRMDPEDAMVALERGLHVGDSAASLEIVKFTDVQCPYCATYVSVLDSLVAHFAGAVSIRYRHFPISTLHPHAKQGAIATECASMQGRFKAFYEEVMGNQGDVGIESWTGFAVRASVPDTVAFVKCMSRDSVAALVESDVTAGHRIGVSVTPFLVIGRTAVPGVRSIDELIEYVGEAEAQWDR